MIELSYVIDMPEFIDSPKRAYNRGMKEAMRSVVELHPTKFLPRHFTPMAKSEYNHEPRGENYNRTKSKRMGFAIDHIRTGRTKKSMMGVPGATIRVGGSATSGFLAGTATYKRLHKVSDGAGGITIRQQNQELTTLTDKEQRQMTDLLAKESAKFIQAAIDSDRAKKRKRRRKK